MTDTAVQLVRAGAFASALAVALLLQRLSPHAGLRSSWSVNGALWLLDAVIGGTLGRRAPSRAVPLGGHDLGRGSGHGVRARSRLVRLAPCEPSRAGALAFPPGASLRSDVHGLDRAPVSSRRARAVAAGPPRGG